VLVSPLTSRKRATVFGAYGHTGRFVVAELRRRGWTIVLSGRDHGKLKGVAREHDGVEVRVAHVDDPASLDAAIVGSNVVINCAGPFIDTAAPIVDSSIRSRVHYLDIAAEQAAVLDVFNRFNANSPITDIAIAPAMAFFGGLGDLMATTAMGEWTSVDEICIAVAMDSWKPTRGTRLTGQRNPGRRLIFTNGRLEPAEPPARRSWVFPAPFGQQEVVSFPLTETIVISRHLRTADVRAFMNVAPLAELRDPETPPPQPADDSGRSSQTFLMDVIARRGQAERRLVAQGQDVYAVTAPIVVEAAERLVVSAIRRAGVAAAGELFDASDFLDALGAHIRVCSMPSG
jgi:Saccharopine dehydrogenase NADP binding domain